MMRLVCSLLSCLVLIVLALPWLDDTQAAPAPVYKEPMRPKEILNSIGMKLVYVKPGKFMMGSPKEVKGRGNDETEHEVEITKGFYLGRYEVTQEEYEKLMGKNPSEF